MMNNKIFEISTSDSKTSKIIQIKGKYFAEVNENNIVHFLSHLEKTLATEVIILKARLQFLDEQIKMYHDY
ncbi:MAG: hypothetical protein ACTHJT_10905 [Cytophaga sp.]|uniref:hypothetical protein n=1 Tax=Cytophaga sp. TaxID=29535 RepID=UPI003F7D889C